METNKMKHTLTPWKVDKESKYIGGIAITALEPANVMVAKAIVFDSKTVNRAESVANAQFIVKACNAYDDLVNTLKQVKIDFEWLISGEWDASTEEGKESALASIDAINKALDKAGVKL